MEAVGHGESLLQSVELAATGGELLMFGLPDTTEPVHFDYHRFFRKKLNMHSTYGAQEEPRQASFKMALELIVRKEIDVSPLVSHVFPVEEIQQAMLTALERRDNALKVSLRF